MSLAVLADHMASKGRNGDTMLVHMAPEEVAGLHALALAHGEKLTINPDTGLPEAFSLKSLLKSLLPAIAGFALAPLTAGTSLAFLGATPLASALTVGGITGLAKGSLKEGILAGLGAYGGASLGAGLSAAGASGTSSAATAAGLEAAAKETGRAALENASMAAAEGITPFSSEAAKSFAQAASPMDKIAMGAEVAAKDPLAFAKANVKPITYALAPAAEQMLAPPNVGLPSLTQSPGEFYGYTFVPGMGYQFQGIRRGASGGLMGSSGIVALADGGTPPPPPPLATREQVLQAYKSNPLATLNPDEEAISHWMKHGLGSFNDVVNQVRAANPMLAKQIDAARAVAQPTPLPLSTAGYNFSAVAANPNAPATISGTAPAGYNYAAAKPTDEIGAQINQLYRNILNRDVEQEGLNHWMGRYEAGLSMPEIEAQIRQIGRDIGVAAPNKPAAVTATAPTTTVTDAGTTYTPADLTAAPVISDPRVTLGDAFQPTAPTMSEVKSAYEQGGGATKMPVITDIKPTDRTYKQSEAFALLQGYLKSNPNALYGDVVAFARGKGIPEMQARAAYNEFRFSDLTGGSSQAYDYLMGRGAYPIKPFTPTGQLSKSYEEAVLGYPENIKAKPYLYDVATQKYVANPAYVPRKSSAELALANPRDQAGNLLTGNPASYFKENPDVYQTWMSGTTGMTADAYARYHWETFGQKEGRKGWTETAAKGGLMDIASAAARGGNIQQYNLGGYSDGGRLLRGPGDGVSDSIPATIGNRQPARLADGEFVIPARIVSEIGNGSTEAGARKLYAMMDRVQRARAKTTGKGKVAKNTKADQYLPA